MVSADSLTLPQLVEIGYEKKVSDVFVKANTVPKMKLNSLVAPLREDLPVIDPSNAHRMIFAMMSDRQRKIFEETFEMDLAFEVEGKCRVRANLYFQRGEPAIVMRVIPLRIKQLDELGLPAVLGE
ncbi:MAG: type IV pili twitching motility protein PilT, partial [Armatimonadota bacterium]